MNWCLHRPLLHMSKSSQAILHELLILPWARGWPNLTCQKFVKRYLKDWCITNELALDRREWKLVIHVSEHWSSIPSFYWLLSSFFSPFCFFDLVFYCLFYFFIWFFYHHLFFSYFSLLFYIFLTHVILSLVYLNLLKNKKLGYCCCISGGKKESKWTKTKCKKKEEAVWILRVWFDRN
jgi:hypothetical protein